MVLHFIVFFFVILYCFQQLSRLSELEEMVAEQDNALAVAAEKYKKSRNEIIKMKKEHEEELNNLKQQMARLASVNVKPSSYVCLFVCLDGLRKTSLMLLNFLKLP